MLEIIYQDAWLVAVNKPAGLLVHRSWLARHETQFVLQQLRDQLGQHVYPVHRLDKPTSGVLLFALSSEVAHDLSQQFAEHRVQKSYYAIVRGWLQNSGKLDYPLLEQRDKIADSQATSDPQLQSAITEYQCLATSEQPVAIGRYATSRYTLMALQPQTGRKHQLRRHMAHLRHPIIGDSAHGDLKQNRGMVAHFGITGLLLHASFLTISHPNNAQTLQLKAAVDARWQRLFQQFGWPMALIETSTRLG
jgi:tRNA pseudouridine65 synthase